MSVVSEKDKAKARARAKNRKNGIAKNGTKLTDAQKNEIRAEYKTNRVTMRNLADKYSVSVGYINKICDGIDKREQSDIIMRVKEDVVEKVLFTDTSMTDKVAIIQAIGNELTNYAVVHDVSHAILASSKKIAMRETVASHELKDVAYSAEKAGKMLGVATCSNSPQIVNTNAVQVNNTPAIPIDEQDAARVYADFIKQ